MSLEDYVFWFFDSIPMLRFNYLKVFINNGDGTYNHLLDIKFINGNFFIPQIVIDKSSETVFRNLIAVEQTSVGRHFVTSYVKLMSTLIRSPDDSNLLERLSIIVKSDDVEDISTFFKSLCSQVAFVDFCYTDLCNEVENYQIPFWRWHRVKGESNEIISAGEEKRITVEAFSTLESSKDDDNIVLAAAQKEKDGGQREAKEGPKPEYPRICKKVFKIKEKAILTDVFPKYRHKADVAVANLEEEIWTLKS
ncbi:hypothetical protein POM88_028196 [Heracleum sosnowskyi]|uniref:Uncharacterized protein n=1 Tax=Heracleum sosnowskyi TaxID=360622 RepID=A0AAD8MQL6_9APIA|nr:hypothetical protein POM88_028196 [Heracleum sosnowskyi]